MQRCFGWFVVALCCTGLAQAVAAPLVFSFAPSESYFAATYSLTPSSTRTTPLAQLEGLTIAVDLANNTWQVNSLALVPQSNILLPGVIEPSAGGTFSYAPEAPANVGFFSALPFSQNFAVRDAQVQFAGGAFAIGSDTSQAAFTAGTFDYSLLWGFFFVANYASGTHDFSRDLQPVTLASQLTETSPGLLRLDVDIELPALEFSDPVFRRSTSGNDPWADSGEWFEESLAASIHLTAYHISVPEPSSFALLGIGALALVGAIGRRRSAQACR